MSLLEGLKRVVNKENIKKTIKTGTAVGAGALLMSTTSCDKPKEQTALEDKNKTEVSDDPEFYRQQYIKYMEHPSYKERLAKEMGDEFSARGVNKEYKQRLKQIKKVLIEKRTGRGGGFYPDSNKVVSTPKSMFHELSHSIDGRIRASFFKNPDNYFEEGFEDFKNITIDRKKIFDTLFLDYRKSLSSEYSEYYPEFKKDHAEFIKMLINYIIKNKDNIKFRPEIVNSKGEDKIFDFILNELRKNGQEFNLNMFWEFFRQEDIDKISKENEPLVSVLTSQQVFTNEIDKEAKRMTDECMGYFFKSTEIRARLNALRIKAVNEFGFDLNNEFDINKFEKLKDEPNYIELRDILLLSDEQINELMKYTAYNFYPPGTNEKEFKKGYHIPGVDYGGEEGQA
ncbi:MAG: hypothetical protein WC603_03205 [Candidatus Paceibacterota bacterium]|jgi:hypothetical protein